MSDLPAGWEWTTLGELGAYLNGRGFKKSEWRDRGRPIIRIQNLTGSGVAFNYYEGEAEERHTVRDGDLLVSWAATLGVYVWRGPEAVLNQHIFKVESHVHPGFHRHLLDFVLSDLQRQTHGSGMVHITKGKFDLTKVPLPPTGEQERIVAAIEVHLSRLDAAAAALTQARWRLASLRSRFIGSFVDLPTTPDLDQDAHAVPLLPGWSWMRASEACEMVSSGSTPEAADMFADAGDVPFIKVYNLQFDGGLDFTTKPTFVTRPTHEGRLRRSRLVPGDVLINIVGPPLGKVSVVPTDHPEWNMNQAVAAFRPGPQLRRDFLRYLLMARSVVEPLLRTGKATAGQINLNISACRRLWLPVPPLSEQASLVRRLDAATSTWKDTVDQTAAASARGNALRRSVLAAAFSGELVPQEPQDEPASVVLERIRAQRAEATPPRRTRVRAVSR